MFGEKYKIRVLPHAAQADATEAKAEKQISPWGAAGIDFVQWADLHELAQELDALVEPAKRLGKLVVRGKDGQLIFRVVRADVRFLEVDILRTSDEIAVRMGLRRKRRGKQNVWRVKTSDVDGGWAKVRKVLRLGGLLSGGI